MADFLESPRLPDNVRKSLNGGPQYLTNVVGLPSGREYRDRKRAVGLGQWTAEHGPHSESDTAELVDFYRALGGRFVGFRWKDHFDYTVTGNAGELGGGIGTGLPTYQLYKIYTKGAYEERRPIYKPVSGSVAVTRNAVAVTAGSGAGQIAIDTTTGIITFVADAISAASAITVGVTTQVVLAANPGSLIAGEKLYLAGFTGADAAEVNGLAHTINSVSGSGPYTFALGTNTSGKTITLGSGEGRAYPQAGDTLAWTGEFDVPVRFTNDNMDISFVTQGWFQWNNVGITEIVP